MKGQPLRAGNQIRCICSRCCQSPFLVRNRHTFPTHWNQPCPLHDQQERKNIYFKRWTICNRFLSCNLQISLNMTSGAGGFAISPHLEFRPIVPIDSPLFSLLADAEKGLRSHNAAKTLENTHERLFELLREGKCSYSDTLPDGNTILHVSEVRLLQ